MLGFKILGMQEGPKLIVSDRPQMCKPALHPRHPGVLEPDEARRRKNDIDRERAQRGAMDTGRPFVLKVGCEKGAASVEYLAALRGQRVFANECVRGEVVIGEPNTIFDGAQRVVVGSRGN